MQKGQIMSNYIHDLISSNCYTGRTWWDRTNWTSRPTRRGWVTWVRRSARTSRESWSTGWTRDFRSARCPWNSWISRTKGMTRHLLKLEYWIKSLRNINILNISNSILIGRSWCSDINSFNGYGYGRNGRRRFPNSNHWRTSRTTRFKRYFFK